MRKGTKTQQLLDGMVSAYIDWLEACSLVQDAYRSWTNATGPGARWAFWRYTAALDAEEDAAEAYASFVRSVGHLATGDGNRSRTLAA